MLTLEETLIYIKLYFIGTQIVWQSLHIFAQWNNCAVALLPSYAVFRKETKALIVLSVMITSSFLTSHMPGTVFVFGLDGAAQNHRVLMVLLSQL